MRAMGLAWGLLVDVVVCVCGWRMEVAPPDVGALGDTVKIQIVGLESAEPSWQQYNGRKRILSFGRLWRQWREWI